MRVLITNGGRLGERTVELLRAAGHEAIAAPLIDQVPVHDAALAAELDTVFEWLGAGEYEWAVITSPAVARLHGAKLADEVANSAAWRSAATRVAAVGQATARSLAEAGIETAVAAGEDAQTGAGLARLLIDGGHVEPGDRVLLLRSLHAHDDIAEALTELGAMAHPVSAYETVPVTGAIDGVDGSAFDVVVLTSGTNAAAAVSRGVVGGSEGPVVVALGRQTAEDARALGLRVDAIADAPTAEAVAEAVASSPRN